MKTQKRPFVVERKFGRRRLISQPASIWGDTDLKALLQKVEADAPHLVEQSIVSESKDTEDLQTDPRSETVSDSIEADRNQPTSALSVELEQVQFHSGDVSRSIVQQQGDSSFGEHTPKLAKRRRNANVPPRPARAESTAGESATLAHIEPHADELDTLDAENRRLKGLLASHLRQQNMQLRTMLERFGM